ncbi:MAG TPA: hypothetical protein VF516_07765 [Kofleriaceae bacterium]
MGKGPVTIELNHTLAELLARLCVELSTSTSTDTGGGGDDPTGVLSRALGLLEMAQRTRRHGGRLVFINERGEMADVVF